MKGWITSVRLVSEFDASFWYIIAKITLAQNPCQGFYLSNTINSSRLGDKTRF